MEDSIKFHKAMNTLKPDVGYVYHNNVPMTEELFNKIIQYSKRYNVEKNNLYFIIGVLYSKTKYKSLLKYYLYLKATRGLKKDYKKELIFLLRSVLPIVMESYIYGVIRKLNRIID